MNSYCALNFFIFYFYLGLVSVWGGHKLEFKNILINKFRNVHGFIYLLFNLKIVAVSNFQVLMKVGT